jgi:predicted DCC family thiol-disulfide oxidoreductase YuxK
MSDATLVYDDDCGFCTWWAERIARHGDVTLVGFSQLDTATRERLPDEYEDCAHLLTDEAVYSCGESIEEALLHTDAGGDARSLVAFLRGFEEYERVRERAYRAVADHRGTLGQFLSTDPPARSSQE